MININKLDELQGKLAQLLGPASPKASWCVIGTDEHKLLTEAAAYVNTLDANREIVGYAVASPRCTAISLHLSHYDADEARKMYGDIPDAFVKPLYDK